MILRCQKGKTRGTFVVLCRHFFIRFFQNDSIAFLDMQLEKVVVTAVILSVAGALFSLSILFPKYLFTPDSPASWFEKCYFLSFIILVFAVISILQWDHFFLDRRDFLNLGHLPISLFRILVAKIAAIGLFIGLYCLSVALASGLIFTVLLTSKQTSILYSVRYFFAHFIVAWLACLFVFFLCAFIQSLFMIILPRNWFRQAGVYLQLIWIFAVMVLFACIDRSLQAASGWLAQSDPRSLVLPPLWFTGLYELLIGRHNPFYFRLALAGIVVLLLLLLVYISVAAIGYRRHFRRQDEQDELISPESKFIVALKRLFLRHPHERVVYDFTVATLKRSSLHRFRIGGFLAVGTALALLLFIKGIALGSTALALAFKIAPLHLLFAFSLISLRAIVEIPVEFDANWIFRSAADERPAVYRSGLIKAAAVRVMLPIAIMGGIFHWLAGGARFALIHTVFVIALAFIILEAAFLRFRKIPFTCSYLPGKAKMKIFAGPYIFAFLFYLILVTLIEQFCLVRPVAMIMGIFLLLAVAGILHWAGLRRKGEALQFFEEPDPVMLSLEIDHD